MKYDPDKHHRRSIRLKGYDYSQAGAYFITIVTQDRLCLFGDVVDGEMRLNDAGEMVRQITKSRRFTPVWKRMRSWPCPFIFTGSSSS